jgi:hypothetical protein
MTKQGNNVNPFTKISKRAFVAILFLSEFYTNFLKHNYLEVVLLSLFKSIGLF